MKNYFLKLLLTFSVIWTASSVSAQQVTLSMASGATAPGGTVSLDISLATSGGAQPAGLQWTLSYPVSDVSGVNIVAGASANAAGKTLTCNSASGSTICVLYALNTTTITDGVVATATFTVPSSSLDSSAPIPMTAVVATDLNGYQIASSGSGATITIAQPIVPTLSGLSCNPASVSAPGGTACTVTLSSPALSGGMAVSLSSSNPNVTVPNSVTVSAGSSSVSFTASVAAVTTAQTATISAVAGTITKTAALSITVPTFSVSGNISPSSMGSGAIVALTGPSSASATADASGNFTFANLVNGTYTIKPSKSGYTFSPVSTSIAVSGANVTGVTFSATQNANQNTAPASITSDAGVWRDQSTSSTTISSPVFSTRYTNELVLAFIATDYSSRTNTIVRGVSGAGLTWNLVVRTNTQKGTAEIWRAFAPAQLSNAAVTATLSERADASMTVMSFSGVDSTGTNGSGAIGATARGSASTGAPAATLVTTRANSLVVGVGDDSKRASARTPGSGQSLVHQYLDPSGNTFWVQMRTATVPASGTSITINDSAPTSDPYNLSLLEILAPQSAVTTGAVASPQSQDQTAANVTAQRAGALSLANIATGEAGDSCTPGGLASIIGAGITHQSLIDKVTGFPLPTTLAGIQVKVNGTLAPLLLVSDAQINFQCPMLPVGTLLTVSVEDRSGVLAPPIGTTMQASAPGVFVVDRQNHGVVSIGNANKLAFPETPGVASRAALPGETLVIYATGLGEPGDRIDVGEAVPADRTIPLKNQVTVGINGREVVPVFAGLVRGSAGLAQVNVLLPEDSPLGDSVSLYIKVTSSEGTTRQSNAVNVAIQRPQ